MSEVLARVSEDLKNAMKAKQADRVSTLRMLKTEIQKTESAKGAKELDEAGLIKVLNTMKKQRLEAIEQYEKAGRNKLADQEKSELKIIESYLPKELSDEELGEIVKNAIAEAEVSDMKGMGKAMKIAVAAAAGRADGKRLSAEVRKQLSA